MDKFYKISRKVNLKYTILTFVGAIIISYFIGLLHIVTVEFIQSIISNNFEGLGRFAGKIGSILTTFATKGGTFGKILAIPILIFVLFPYAVSLFLLFIVSMIFESLARCRNKTLLIVINITIFFVAFIVSNKYELNSWNDFFMLAVISFLGFIVGSFSSSQLYCDNCLTNYSYDYSFYSLSKHNSKEFLEIIHKEIDSLENKYTEEEILNLNSMLNIYKIILKKCGGCNSKVVHIINASIKIDSDGQKSINEGREIVNKLIMK
jgi:hypothetical protein